MSSSSRGGVFGLFAVLLVVAARCLADDDKELIVCLSHHQDEREGEDAAGRTNNGRRDHVLRQLQRERIREILNARIPVDPKICERQCQKARKSVGFCWFFVKSSSIVSRAQVVRTPTVDQLANSGPSQQFLQAIRIVVTFEAVEGPTAGSTSSSRL